MDEFDYDDDVELTKPLDERFVILGLSLLIASLIIIPFVENQFLKYIGFLFLISSFFVMTKKKLV
ncbi:MAG TPA: hypothetical protein PKE69_05910 [Pyrinomonadaceae bacterium]|nr:hypothetical protein [Pyrinomonadaceae bacterium]